MDDGLASRGQGDGQDGDGSGGKIRADFIPAERYTSSEGPELEKRRLWPRVWQIVCRESELPNVGDYILYEICDE